MSSYSGAFQSIYSAKKASITLAGPLPVREPHVTPQTATGVDGGIRTSGPAAPVPSLTGPRRSTTPGAGYPPCTEAYMKECLDGTFMWYEFQDDTFELMYTDKEYEPVYAEVYGSPRIRVIGRFRNAMGNAISVGVSYKRRFR